MKISFEQTVDILVRASNVIPTKSARGGRREESVTRVVGNGFLVISEGELR